MRVHVLDANALYRYLTNGDGAEVVADVFRQALAANTPVIMSVINWGEVFYTSVKYIGLTKSERLLTQALENIPLSLIIVQKENAFRAARINAQYGIPYADAYAAELTGGQHVLVTADVDHFARIPKIRLLKLPSHKKQ